MADATRQESPVSGISIIIPTLNEAEGIRSLLDRLRSMDPGAQLIVVDGGSDDGTTDLARGVAEVVPGPRGRATQMNDGARLAAGEVLWFLHADCVPHAASFEAIRTAMRDPGIAGGAFEYALDAPGLFYRITEAISNRKNRLAKLLYGDMGIFVRAALFHRMGGYREMPLMEDMDLCRRLKREGGIVILPHRIMTSARRWKAEGRFFHLVRTWALQIAWGLGVSPARLANHYAFPARKEFELELSASGAPGDRARPPKGTRDFDSTLASHGLFPLHADRIEVLQINFGKRCNLACSHCHVEAGPARMESIGRGTLETCLRVLQDGDIGTVDLTGGAPELSPHFRWFVQECRRLDRRVIVRTNLTVLLEPGREDLAGFLRDQGVEIIASLPCYTEGAVDAQRGRGVYARSVAALRRLNGLGFGAEGSGLRLDLVYNPGDASLPGAQSDLEADYKRELFARHGIEFDRLLTLTNMPIGRFEGMLTRRGIYEPYMDMLAGAFNPKAASVLMCRSTLSVGFDGSIYDCDFNQMLGLTCDHGAPRRIEDFDRNSLQVRQIVTGPHCFGCTAGAGSSCGGALT